MNDNNFDALLDAIAPPADLLASYDDVLIDDNINMDLTLNKEQASMVLALHDYGLDIITDDNKHLFYSIIADIKNKITRQ